ncbi:MAG: amino acid permease [Chlamydiales bacterium]|nr:amino acid permease [Chlamydiales bacterium]
MSSKGLLNVRTLTLLNIVTILSVKNWPFMAQYGLASVFFILLPALFFFLPAALVSAELATGWPEEGGVFVWVKNALGERFGFLAVWLMWVSNVVWYPTILAFIAISFSYVINPAFAENKLFHFSVVNVVFWSAVFINLKGLKESSFLSSLCSILGTLLPAVLVIGFGAYWVFSGRPVLIDFSWKAFIPEMKGINEWVFVTGILLGFAGIEMNAIHANNVENPQKSYPRAIFLSTFIIVLLSVLGTLSISLVMTPEKINLAGAIIELISFYLSAYHLSIFFPLFCLLVIFGGLGSIGAWIIGPNRGLTAASQDGKYLPKPLCSLDRNGLPRRLMLFQAVIVTVLSSVFLIFPSMNLAFWILIALASQLYLIMYILMFVSGIVLRYKHPQTSRLFRIPFRNIGMWFVAGGGIFSALFAISVGFVPPQQFDSGSLVIFEMFLILSMIVFCSFPFLSRLSFFQRSLKQT